MGGCGVWRQQQPAMVSMARRIISVVSLLTGEMRTVVNCNLVVHLSGSGCRALGRERVVAGGVGVSRLLHSPADAAQSTGQEQRHQ